MRARGGIPTASAYVRTWSGSDHFGTETCDQGGHLGMRDSVAVGTLAVDHVGCS